jgi:cytochrome c-type biogenesis protein CcmH/NrfG
VRAAIGILDPEFWVGHYQVAQAAVQLDRSDLAFDALPKAAQFSGGNSKAIALCWRNWDA